MSVEAATEAILRHPNMNDTGRLPSICMLHVGMRAGLTLTVEPLVAVVDATGVVKDIIPDPREPSIQRAQAVHALQYMPLAVLFQLDDSDAELLPPKYCERHESGAAEHNVVTARQCPHCKFFQGEIYIAPQLTHQRFRVPVTIQRGGERGDITYELSVQRLQLPLTIITACTLHTLQGTTADPGLIFHWTFPRRVSKMMRWLSVYVALSRPRSLAQLRSIGLSDAIREIIQQGSPKGLLDRFEEFFGGNIEKTKIEAAKVLEELRWADK